MSTPVTSAAARPRPFWLQALVVLAVALVANVLAGQFFFRADLTEDDRFTLSETTLATLDSIKAPLVVRVYVEGASFPPTIKRFQQSIRTLLEEMRAQAGSNLQVRFVNPLEDTSALRRFREMGIQPVPVRVSENELATQQLVMFPVAEVVYGADLEVIDLMKGTAAEKDLGALMLAEQQLEYKFVSTFRRLILSSRPTIGLLQGHGEYGPNDLGYFLSEAARAFQIVPVDFSKGTPLMPRVLPAGTQPVQGATAVDVLMVVQPQSALSEADKFLIDQYVLRGGKVLWVLDNEEYSQIDLEQQGRTLAQPRRLNLDDLFFKYGFKVNADLVQDRYCGFIDAIQTINGRDVTSPQKYVFFPRVLVTDKHPLLRNVDEVLFRYASTIDTLSRAGLRHTVLLKSSPLSRIQAGTVAIDFNLVLEESMAQLPPRQAFVDAGRNDGLLMGLLTEGTFSPLFAGRGRPENTGTFSQLDKATAPSAMIVLSDGALPLGNHSRVGSPMPPLDNTTLLLNSVEYLAGDEALTAIRGRQVRIRVLDAVKARSAALEWQLLNMLGPVLLVVGFGVGRYWLRRRRNAR